MANRLSFNGYTPKREVDKDGYTLNLATTSTSSSGRSQRGHMYNTVMFTVESYNLKWTNIPASQAAGILKQVLGKSSFNFHYYSMLQGKWTTDKFYVANVTSPIISLKDGEEKVRELSFQVTKIDPV